jgi:uncharacterized protein YdiU (UPF0061 family)
MLHFDNRFARLPGHFYTRQPPQGIPDPHWVSVNRDAAALLDLDAADFDSPALLAALSGNTVLPGSEPLAMIYSGHQFGHYNPQLGDGRGLLIGEVNGTHGRFDLHLKGAGMTPYSRQGDGRAVLRSSIREYLASEALHALGIPTTRALAITGSHLPVYREEVETAAIVTRLARTHIRFGHFEFFFYTKQHDALKQLADHAIALYFPEFAGQPDQYALFLQQVTHRTASLIAHWQAYGFAHGVLNTDNMSILGETFDFGPYGFLDDYEPGFICNHSDHAGRYAFDQQPGIGLWNLNAFAHALSPLIAIEDLKRILGEYQAVLTQRYATLMRARLGFQQEDAGDQQLLADWLDLMAESKVDYTQCFRSLCDDNRHASLRNDFVQREAFDHWLTRYRARREQEAGSVDEHRMAMQRTNPQYILRNYLAQQAIEKAGHGDFSEVDRLLAVLKNPFDERPGLEAYAEPPPSWGKELQISCSS